MEQLAQFVTKSFEYNNNRVLDLLNMAIKIDNTISKSDNNNENVKFDDSKNSSDIRCDDSDEDDESVEIDITDEPSNESTNNKLERNKQKCEEKLRSSDLPLPLLNKNVENNNNSNQNHNKKYQTKNWLISENDSDDHESLSESDDKKIIVTDENLKPSTLPNNNALNLSRSNTNVPEHNFRPKPVTELLKEIKKFHDVTPPPLSTRLDNNYESRSPSPNDIIAKSKGTY